MHSAAIAFFTIFSLPALLIVISFIGTLFFSGKTVRTEIVKEVEDLINANAAEQVKSVLENLSQLQLGFWEVLLGVVVVLQGASVVFFMIQKALNTVWQVKVKPDVKLWRVIKHRLIALVLVVGLGLLLTLSLMLDTVVSVFSQQLQALFEEHLSPAIRIMNTAFYLVVVLGFFTAVHKVLPDARVSWKDALAGGLISSILFLLGKELINTFLGSVKIVGIYAAAGSLVVVLLWVFYSSLVFVLGAEITKAYANMRGREIEPTSIAMKYEREKIDL